MAAELDKKHPGAAASLREGMAETLDHPAPGCPADPGAHAALDESESMISICRDHAANVKNWRDGTMALRWCAAGMNDAAQQFRRVNGFMQLARLRANLDRYVADQKADSTCYNKTVA